MENFQLGVQAVLRLLEIELSVLFYSPVMRGFFAGYIVASLVYGFVRANTKRRRNKNLHA